MEERLQPNWSLDCLKSLRINSSSKTCMELPKKDKIVDGVVEGF